MSLLDDGKVVTATLDCPNGIVALSGSAPPPMTFDIDEGESLSWNVTNLPADGSRLRIRFVSFPRPHDPVPLLVDASLEASAGETLGGLFNPDAHEGTYEYEVDLVDASQVVTTLKVQHPDGSITPKASGQGHPKPPDD
jgi:hypothetical protein